MPNWVAINGSFIWKSILAARQLFNEGLIWKIGNGESMKIWHDKGVPKPSSFRIQTPVRLLDGNAKVKDLIDNNSKHLNLSLLKEIFSDSDYEIISRIPISLCNSSDRLAWRCTADGKFSVKSASNCPLCLKEPETVVHALWSCRSV